MDADKVKMSGTAKVMPIDGQEVDRNLALLDEAVTRLAPLMQAQLIVERVTKVLGVLEAHENLIAGKGVHP